MEGSPPEDYNPLADDSTGFTDEHVEEEEVHASPCSSLEYDDPEVTDYLKYAITPPNTRAIKRSKVKKTSSKSRKSIEKNLYGNIKFSRKSIPHQNSSMSDDLATPISVSADETDDFIRDSADACASNVSLKKRNSGKGFNRIRSFDRDLKQSITGQTLPSNFMPCEDSAVIKPIKVDTPNRFFSLNSKPVHSSHDHEKCEVLSPKRQISSVSLECPREREQFYKTFSMLIKMGDNVSSKKDKESRYSRQISSEQEVWQNKLNDLIWLNLQAWFHNRNDIRDEDQYLLNARENIEKVLNKIMTFSFTICKQCNSINCNQGHNDLAAGDLNNRDTYGEYSTLCDTDIFNVIPNQLAALNQVKQLLEELESAEKLYPTLKHFRKAHPVCSSVEFTTKVNAFYMWVNITEDLIWKLQLIASVLHIDQRETYDWPYLQIELETPMRKLEKIRNCDNVIKPELPSESDTSVSDIEDVSEEEIETNIKNGIIVTKASGRNVRFSLDPDTSINSQSASDNSELSPVTSTPKKAKSGASTVLLGSFSSASLDEQSGSCIYRYFADRMLRKTGMRKMQKRLQILLKETLERAKSVLKSLRQRCEDNVLDSDCINFCDSPNEEEQVCKEKCAEEMCKCGLPSFKPAYLFLARIPMDVVHECIQIRLEQMSETEPHLLSIRELIRECKEVLNGSVSIKQFYKEFVGPVISPEFLAKYESDLENFEKDMKLLLEVYLKYVQSWMSSLQSMPEASKRLKGALEDEWQFTRSVCPHVQGGEAQAGNSFCRIASGLLDSISHFLDSEIDDCVQQLYDSTLVYNMDDEEINRRHSRTEIRQGIIQCCRHFKLLFHEARERASKAVSFAKMLRKDLEIAAAFHVSVPGEMLMQKLYETNHVRVKAPHSADYLTFVPDRIASDNEQILRLLNICCGREDSRIVLPTDIEQGYLLLVHCPGMTDTNTSNPIWQGKTLNVEPNAETTIALSHIAVDGLMLVVHQSSQLAIERKGFEQQIGETVEILQEQTSCHQGIAESLMEMKHAAMELRTKLAQAITQVDEKLDMDDIPAMDDGERFSIMKLYRETLQQCYNFGFEYHKELTRLISGELKLKVGKDLVAFAKQWMRFVSDKCERGRGRRPRWAGQGLDFLIVACHPKILALLTDQEFAELKQALNNCINHVVGDRLSVASPGGGYGGLNSPDIQTGILRYPSWPESQSTSQRTSSRSFSSEPPTPFPGSTNSPKDDAKNVDEDGDEGGIFMNIGIKEQCPNERFAQAVQKLEQEQTNKMYSKRIIGQVTDRVQEVDYHVNIKRVNFKWQRGNKIGEGQFKVYAAVNMDSGELMAMKEIRLQPNDLQSVKGIADEIKIFEGINHKSLVKYYGVELHRDEMLIFMEYCNGGTLEDMAKLGLNETQIRKYTKEILAAVHVLHDHSIIHRDIKGANIFLISDGSIKLGDFGCAAKLKSHTTMPGEINTLVGTTAYMAPEVITRNTEEGSGRASDIWSLGCVVIEMATGTRPWSELENNMQIMFKVGMGGSPAIPGDLSHEGKDFLSCCFKTNPKERSTAAQLLDHPFVKVYTEPDES